MQKFLEFVVRQLVDQPDDLIIQSSVRGETGQHFNLLLPRAEVGKVIGKQGYTIRAIRGLLSATAARHGQTASLEISERPDA